MNKILKMLIPSSKKLAVYAADGIQRCVNSSQKEAEIAKWSQLADKCSDVQKKITTWLIDGKIDELERNEIAEELAPLFEKIRDMI